VNGDAALSDLDRLALFMDEQQGMAARLGYALGLLHGADPDRAPDIALDGPEIRAIEDMDLG
jgi:hypothetical protein